MERIPPINIGTNALLNASLKLTFYGCSNMILQTKKQPAYKIGKTKALAFNEISK
jgi:hypothetical protein